MIHVCFSLYDKYGTYSKFTGTTILSIFENTITPQKLPSITVHILHDNTLTPGNREKFSYVAGQYNQLVKFYNVEELCANKLAEIVGLNPTVKNSRLSVGAMYRLLTPQVLPADINKVIYLDSDIIVNLDLKELWKIKLGDKALAAVSEILSFKTVEKMNDAFPLCRDGFVKPEDYFNSGVLLMNLELFRAAEKKLVDSLKVLTQKPDYLGYADQDVLNYCFSNNTLKLSKKFNRFTLYARRERERPTKKIYHYAGGSFGYGLTFDMRDPFNALWLKYFAKTPWLDEETIKHLSESFLQVQAAMKNSALKLTAAISGKTRAFFTVESEVSKLFKNFFVRDDEEVFIIPNKTSLQEIIDVMDSLRGEKFFFILMPNFPFQSLIEEGFVFGKDFLNGYDFLSEANSVPLNSYPLVQAM